MPPITPSQTIGPFFAHALPFVDGGTLVPPGAPAASITIEITVKDGAGQPVPDALLECWQADESGRYAHPADLGHAHASGFRGFGRISTDDSGHATLTTVKPGAVSDRSGRQAPHIALSVFARGVLTRLVTRMYFDDDPPAADDPVFTLVPATRRKTLLARGDGHGGYRFDVVLQGDGETVFFDL